MSVWRKRAGISLQVIDYAPDNALDLALARLSYSSISTRSDHRPVTQALVRSRLTHVHGGPPTTLLLCRENDSGLLGAAALRWPERFSGTGKLWGPVVANNHRARHLGSELLELAMETASKRPEQCTRWISAEIPATDKAAIGLFIKRDWQVVDRGTLLRGDVETLERSLLSRDSPFTVQSLATLQEHDREIARRAVVDLYRDCYPALGEEAAKGALERWRRDERFREDALIFLRTADGTFSGAILLYPLDHLDSQEPSECLIAMTLLPTGLGASAVIAHAALLAEVVAFCTRFGIPGIRVVLAGEERRLIRSYLKAGLSISCRVCFLGWSLASGRDYLGPTYGALLPH
jgi:hypothetical protein